MSVSSRSGMTIPMTRTDTSVLSRWWWTVDKLTLFLLCGLTGLGLLMTSAASPAVAERLGLPPMHFVLRQALHAQHLANPEARGLPDHGREWMPGREALVAVGSDDEDRVTRKVAEQELDETQ